MAAEASASRIIPAPLNPAIDPEDPFNAPVSPVSPLSEASFSPPALPAAAAAEPLLPTVTPARLPPQRPETQTGTLAPTFSSSTVPAAPSESSSASLLASESGEFCEKYNEKGERNAPRQAGVRRDYGERFPWESLFLSSYCCSSSPLHLVPQSEPSLQRSTVEVATRTTISQKKNRKLDSRLID